MAGGRPKEFDDRFEMRITASLRDKLAARAEANGRPVAAEAREAIERWVADEPAGDGGMGSF